MVPKFTQKLKGEINNIISELFTRSQFHLYWLGLLSAVSVGACAPSAGKANKIKT